jgi:hypothetical protein
MSEVHYVQNWKFGVICILSALVCIAIAVRVVPQLDPMSWIIITVCFVLWDRLIALGWAFLRGFEIHEEDEEEDDQRSDSSK